VSASDQTFQVEMLASHHDRADFTCGVEALDRYIRQQASQDVRSGVSAVFILTPGQGVVSGYYTLSATAVHLAAIPQADARKLPRYDLVPATLLGRLAISEDIRGQKLGGVLLLDALKRARSAAREVASWAVIVDAKDDAARAFYERFEFRQVLNEPSRLFLPMKKIEFIPGRK